MRWCCRWTEPDFRLFAIPARIWYNSKTKGGIMPILSERVTAAIIMPLFAAGILSLFVLGGGGGCSWLESPVDPAVTASVNEARLIQADLSDRLAEAESTIAYLASDPNLTDDEYDILYDLRTTADGLRSALSDVNGFLDRAKTIADEAGTNADLVVAIGDEVAEYLPPPFGTLLTLGLAVFGGVQTKRKISESGRLAESESTSTKLKTAIVNLEDNRTKSTGLVDWPAVKLANADAGINKFLKAVREGG
jgi:hypothetical protein